MPDVGVGLAVVVDVVDEVQERLGRSVGRMFIDSSRLNDFSSNINTDQ